MRILQRYILSELLRVFFFLLSVLTVMLFFVGVFREASENGLGPYHVVQILPYVVPSMLPFTVPATLLLTICVVYGRLSGDLEVTAAKAAGISVMSLLNPALAFGAVLTVCSFFLTDQVIPWAMDNIQRVVTGAVEQIFLDKLSSEHLVSDPNHGYSISVTGVDGQTLINPTFKYTLNGRDPVTVGADAARMDFDLDNQRIILHLRNTAIISGNRQRLEFEEDSIPFPLPSEIRRPKARHLTIPEVSQRLVELDRESANAEAQRDWQAAMALAVGEFDRFEDEEFQMCNARVQSGHRTACKFKTELHNRFAMAASCFLFALLGSPFAVLQARRQFLTSFIMVFAPLLFVYYPIVFLMMNLSKTGTVEAWWSVWVANAVVLAAGLYYLRRVLRH